MTNLKWLILIVAGMTGFLAVTGRAGPAAAIQWIEERNGEVLFSSDDLVRFDWDRQVFELKRERAMDLAARFGTFSSGGAFAVRDAEGVLYSGRFISPAQSASYEGPTIRIDWQVKPPFFGIDASYHGRKGEDKRFAPRLKAGLEKAGVLREITVKEQEAAPLERVRSEWSIKAPVRGRAELYSETLRVGGQARVHVFLIVDEQMRKRADVVEAELTLKGNQGRFVAKAVVRQEAGEEFYKRGVMVCRVAEWMGAMEAGEGELGVRMVFRKRVGEVDGDVKYSDPVGKIEVPGMKVKVLAEGR